MACLASTSGGDRLEDFAVQDAVRDVARRLDVPMARVVLAWVLSKSAVCAPIVGATKEAHVRDAMASLDLNLNLSEDDLARVESPYVPRLLSDF